MPAALLLLAACERVGREEAVLELGGDTIRLGGGARIVEIDVAARAGGRDFEPESVTASPGDVVRFRASDSRTHAIVFDAAGLEPALRDYMDGQGQLRGPPLVETGASWVVSLASAPPGSYPFICITHDARGLLSVGAP